MNSSYILLNNLRFHYLHWNLDGGTRAIVCHHGLASNARIWELTAPHLERRDFSVYALDARGHGLSDKPDEGYDIDTVTRDMAEFIHACHLERPVLAGHSWGANILLNYAAKFSFGPLAPAAIILVDGGITQLDDTGRTWEQMELDLTPPRLAGTPVEEFRSSLRSWNAHWGASEAAIEVMLANFEISEDDRIYPRLTLERHLRILRSIWDFKTREYFTRVRCPVLMVPARMDGAETAGREGYAAARQRGLDQARQSIRELRIRWMENTIHDVPLQRPGELAQAIDDFVSDTIKTNLNS